MLSDQYLSTSSALEFFIPIQDLRHQRRIASAYYHSTSRQDPELRPQRINMEWRANRTHRPSKRELVRAYTNIDRPISGDPPRGNTGPTIIVHSMKVRLNPVSWSDEEDRALATLMLINKIDRLPLSGAQVDLLEAGMASAGHDTQGKTADEICARIELSPSFAEVLNEVANEHGSNSSSAASDDGDGTILQQHLRLWTLTDVSALLRHNLIFDQMNIFHRRSFGEANAREMFQNRYTYLARVLGREEWEIVSFLCTRYVKEVHEVHVQDCRYVSFAKQLCSLNLYRVNVGGSRCYHWWKVEELLLWIYQMWYELRSTFKDFPNATECFVATGLLRGLEGVFVPTVTRDDGNFMIRRPQYKFTSFTPRTPVFDRLEVLMKQLDSLRWHYPSIQGQYPMGADGCTFNNGRCGGARVSGGDYHCREHRHVDAEMMAIFKEVEHLIDNLKAKLRPVNQLLRDGVFEETERAILGDQSIPKYDSCRGDAPTGYQQVVQEPPEYDDGYNDNGDAHDGYGHDGDGDDGDEGDEDDNDNPM